MDHSQGMARTRPEVAQGGRTGGLGRSGRQREGAKESLRQIHIPEKPCRGSQSTRAGRRPPSGCAADQVTPERGQRKLEWFRALDAASFVRETELKSLLSRVSKRFS